jgi:pimeloyl-ACP methyl ester carboxylesterase/ketosteroid isomerase-like protein
MITQRTVDIDGIKVFVREAGDRGAPAIVLLHGFPSSSHMFRELIPRLADRFRVIAPDLVGYGHSDAPPVGQFSYTFDNLADVTRKVLQRLEVDSYVLYLNDFGGPVGMRLATSAPERVRGLVIQNANAYMEGVSEAVANLFLPLWKEQNATTLAAARAFLSAEATKMQYTAGARNPAQVSPDAWTLDQALLDRPGVAEAQLSLFIDYEKNVGLYDAWHAYFRAQQPRTLVLWGKNDPFFLAAGAEAYKRDLPAAEVVLLDGGHFALEEHADAIADHIKRTFLPLAGAALVRSFYGELSEGKLDAALSRLAKDVRWRDPKGFPYGGELTSPSQVRTRVFEAIAADWPSFGILAERFIEGTDGRTVVVLGRYTGRHGKSNRSLDVPFAHVWGTVGGELASFFTHTDTAELRAAMAV